MEERDRSQTVEKSALHNYSYNTIIGIENFPEICRYCLHKCDPRNIFRMSYKNLGLCDIIETCTSIQVVKGDGLPENICIQCMNILVIFFEFAQKCQHANNLLKEVLKAKEVSQNLKEADAIQNFSDSAHEMEEVAIKIEEQDPLEVEQRDPLEIDRFDPLEIEQHRSGAQEKNYDEVTKVPMYVPIKVEHVDDKRVSGEDKGSEQKATGASKEINRRGRRETVIIENPRMTLEKYRKKYSRPTIGCPICEERFPSMNKVVQHCKATGHMKPKNHKCTICEKTFCHRTELQSHITTHTKERNHPCLVCGKRFILRKTLKLHVLIHTGKMKHVCEICGKGFIQTHGYQAHMRTHTGERPFLCSYCGKSFTSTSNHLYHERQHEAKKVISEIQPDKEPVKEYACKVCNKAFSSRGTLRKHGKTHGDKIFCCGKDFVTKGALQDHSKTLDDCTDLGTPEKQEKTFVLLC